ncbi:MAG TPA: hypothetical protein VL221_13015 [Bacteroidota bacterium]|nr:hypothetical protein [Bacteroidota bacterium]
MSGERDDLLEFFYFGFHRTLVRFRRLTVQGWGAAALGVVGLAFAWGRGEGLIAFAVAAGALVAGLALVQQAVAALDQYVRIPYPRPGPGAAPETLAAAVEESARLMGEIERGGWQDAFAAIAVLETMAVRFGLPPVP